jgi:carboxymethylenebutenolidase
VSTSNAQSRAEPGRLVTESELDSPGEAEETVDKQTRGFWLGAMTLFLALGLCLGCGSSGEDDYAERMAIEHEGDEPLASGAAGQDPGADVDGEDVVYAEVGGVPVTGYLAKPAGGGTGLPGIIVIQEWWGLNDNIRSMARQLAGQGYTALAVDLYQGQVATDPETARSLMSDSMGREADLEQNLQQAYAYLTDQTAAPRVGVIGWCFGGGWSLRTALMLPGEIDGAVIYYGHLITDRDRLATLDVPVLGIFGAEDGGIPLESVREFEAVLNDLGKDALVVVYDGAEHAFANPSGTRYDAGAAEDAWAETLAFFEKHLEP